MRSTVRRNACLLSALICLLAGCGRLAPPATPAQLEQTAGAPVTLTGAEFSSTAFQLHYPSDWSVITGPASAPPWVVFVSPDESAMIAVSAEMLDSVPQPPQREGPALRTEERMIEMRDGRVVYAWLVAPEPAWAESFRLFEQVVGSLES
ncbi:MAG: hypothetical protein SF029_01985 [bacterium]|nr:hypothetical protein [bacterium]